MCPYCGRKSKFVTGRDIFLTKKKFHTNFYYLCKFCDAYVGVHTGTVKPLGRLANKSLRCYRIDLHECFDYIWKNKYMNRSEAYSWLALKLKINIEDCHIGVFDLKICKKAMNICMKYIVNINS